MGGERGSIAVFSAHRPPVPLDLYSSPIEVNGSKEEEECITDGKSSNFNGRAIPRPLLTLLLFRPKILSSIMKEQQEEMHKDEGDDSSGRISGAVFISERTSGLETLHFSVRLQGCEDNKPRFKVFPFAEAYKDVFQGIRMEDSPCIAGDHLIYVSTKEPASQLRQPWTAVYATDLYTGETQRLTPSGTADLSPSVSPSGKKLAVASFEYKPDGWNGEIEDLRTDIVVIDLIKQKPPDDTKHKSPKKQFSTKRKLVVHNGGWPTWGSEDILFFHRREKLVVEEIDKETGINEPKLVWGVFQANISNGSASKTCRVTPKGIDAMTPAAISATKVAVATIRQKLDVYDIREKPEQYRHIEIFDTSRPHEYCQRITQNIAPMADHYNPFVMEDGKGIGYHRCRSTYFKSGDVSRGFDELQSPVKNVGLLRVSGVFPTFSSDGKKLAFVDNEFKKVWLADSEGGLRPICTMAGRNKVFCPVWNQNPEKDTLYICRGEAFAFANQVVIEAIHNASLEYGPGKEPPRQQLTQNGCYSAFPSTNCDGTKLVFQSTRDWVGPTSPGKTIYTNLYLLDTESDDYINANTRLTAGEWVDSYCQWSPVNSHWIVFSSTRGTPKSAPALVNGLDPGYYAVYLLSAMNPSVVVRVIGSDKFDKAWDVNHPCFSPDGRNIIFIADLAAVSADPISMPLFVPFVRPYGDVFSIDINPDDIRKNENMKNFTRITHSRYENGRPCWIAPSINIQDLISKYKLIEHHKKS